MIHRHGDVPRPEARRALDHRILDGFGCVIYRVEEQDGLDADVVHHLEVEPHGIPRACRRWREVLDDDGLVIVMNCHVDHAGGGLVARLVRGGEDVVEWVQ